MPRSGSAIELSLIVPVLNEAEGIGTFLRGLAAQQGVSFQVILCDGGSTDDTVARASALNDKLPFSLFLLHAEKGRARQMNAGTRVATGEYFLFLHADSTFVDPFALRQGLSLLRQEEQRVGDVRIAAHFSLRFQESAGSISFAYYLAAGKARLERAGCTHGDQGFLLNRRFFAEAGPFDQSCLAMEDTRFAENVRAKGSWLLLPLELVTSVRRFEAEGLLERNVLNMILMTLAAVGREDFIREMPGIYATQCLTGKLRLFPYLDRIRQLIKGLPSPVRMRFWYTVGRYVSLNAWQIPFFLDMRKSFRKAVPVVQSETTYLNFFDRHGEKYFRTSSMAAFAAGLTYVAFHGVCIVARYRDW